MLKQLRIQNYALIEDLDIYFDKHFNVITGETGAGKSILLGAIGLILGNRIDNSVFFNKNNKCIIEGNFAVPNGLKHFFVDNDLDYDENTIIRREITTAGKSRAFINDTPVNLDVLQEFSEKMIDIHNQQQHTFLNHSNYQLSVVDTFAGNNALLHEFKQNYLTFKKLNNQLHQLETEEQNARKDYDYNLFLRDEIDNINPDPAKDAEIEEELQTLTHAEKIKRNIEYCLNALEDNETGIISQINNIRKQLQEILNINSQIQHFNEFFENQYFEVKEFSSQIQKFLDHTEINEEKLNLLLERQNQLNHLLNKHRLTDVNELVAFRNALNDKIENSHSLENQISTLKSEIEIQKQMLLQIASELSKSRNDVIPVVENELIKLLAQVGMPNSRIKIESEILSEDDINEFGKDKITFTFSSNPGIPLHSIQKAASGGELSRLMLCVKTLLAGSALFSTLIFDEIDQGVSGEIALQVGNLLSKISNKHQIICITHLPQIAAKGNLHFKVIKEIQDNTTATKVNELDRNQRIKEIAQMIGGNNPPDSAFDSAKVLLEKKS